MSEIEVPFEDAVEIEDELEAEASEDVEEPDIEAPEADFAEQRLEVDLDDDDYR
ncbi:hypothetical protein [Actinopolymorpha pittospori]|uniref:Uncharacterized protein n=1 Tax=Actinopolymorpha pittospori TaxID=648752 RepID=A0A927RP45_9ACTN|nr:hypothetical protein [Actinopolymorpha pittospori]MBE1611761.1 hypothetical protein [Actinopolymorpha pittospori]